jgi:hypothetical protein
MMIDTLKFANRLRSAGFSQEQAEMVADSWADVEIISVRRAKRRERRQYHAHLRARGVSGAPGCRPGRLWLRSARSP